MEALNAISKKSQKERENEVAKARPHEFLLLLVPTVIARVFEDVHWR